MTRRIDFARIIAARYLSRAGSEAAFFVGVWGKAAFDFQATAGQLAIVMLALSIVSIAGSIIGGVLVDRFGPRRTLIGAEMLFAPAALAIVFADSLTSLTVLAAIWGFVGAPVMTAGASFAPFLAKDEEQLTKVNAWLEAAGSAAFVTGPAAGAFIVHYVSVDWVFYVDAITSVIAAVLVWRARLARPVKREAHTSAFAEFREGVSVAYGSRSLRFYVLGGTVAWLGFGAFSALEPLFYRDAVGTSIEALGYVNSLFGVGILVGSYVLSRLPRGAISARGLSVTLILSGLGSLAYVGTTDLRFIALGAVVWGIVLGVMEPLLRTLVHRDSPAGLVGRITGTAMVHRQAGELVPLAFAPALAATFGVQATLIGGGLLISIIAAIALFEAAAIDRERRGRPVPAVPFASFPLDEDQLGPLL